MKSKRNPIIFFCFIFLLIFLSATSSIAENFLPIPDIKDHVTDKTNTLSSSDRRAIEKLLTEYEKETTHQIEVLIIPTLKGESIESFSLRVANSLKFGHKGIDNGVLVTLAMKERKVRIELGLGMAKYISNTEAKSIIDNSMVPSFKKGNFSKGLKDGLWQLMNKARKFKVQSLHENNPSPQIIGRSAKQRSFITWSTL